MFIKASRKQRKGQPKGLSKASTLHRQLARSRAWRSRLFICSSVALGVSALVWLFDPPLTLHLALVGGGFLAGFAWPLGGNEPWALAWIDAQAGLAYRTALEREHEADPYGFEQALSTQVERSTKRLELPTAQPWWLPLLAVALSLAVLPALSWPAGLGGLGGGGDNSGAPLADSEASEQATVEETTSPDAEDAETQAAEGATQNSPELERTFDAPGEDPAQAGGTNDDAQGEGQSADSETLERYLESLEAQDAGSQEAGSEDAGTAPSGAERNPFERSGAQQGEQTDGSSAEQGSQGGQSAEQGAQQAQQQDQGGQQSEADEVREAREGAQGGEEGAQAQQSQQQSQQGQQENSSEPQAGQEGNGASAESPQETQAQDESQAGNAEGSPAQQEQQAQGEQQSAPGESEGAQEGQDEQAGTQGAPDNAQNPAQSEGAQGGSPSPQAGEQNGGGAQGAANGAGNLPSAATPSAAERLETPPTGPERLAGERGAGVINQAGETFAPGSDDVNIPGGRSAAEYNRAAEEAINEGRIPVEYQNILRDYFR